MEGTSQTILLIDDSHSKFSVGFAKVGKSYGFTIHAFDSIQAGLLFLSLNEKEIVAVLLDLSFTPNKYEGVEALQQIKKNNALLPVIMLPETYSEKDIETAVNCLKAGAFNYVVKKDLNPASLFPMLKVAVRQYVVNTDLHRYNSLKEEYANKVPMYEQMLNTTEMILKNTFQNKLMFSPTFEKRIKGFNSFYDKVLSKEKEEGNITEPFKRVTDIAGLRVVFYNSADMLKAIQLLTAANDFKNVKAVGELKGDDKSKTYGYRAVHFDVKINSEKRMHLDEYKILSEVPCEIQFKTIFAHSWSKVYHALSYKEIGELKLSTEEKEKLDADFKTAAKDLEAIEKQITDLCAKYYPVSRQVANAN